MDLLLLLLFGLQLSRGLSPSRFYYGARVNKSTTIIGTRGSSIKNLNRNAAVQSLINPLGHDCRGCLCVCVWGPPRKLARI